MAQTIVLDQRQRQGTHTSASVVVPVGVSSITITTDIAPADLNSTKQVRLLIEHSADDGQTWQAVSGFAWTGPTTVSPALSFALTDYIGQRLRAVLDIPDQLRVGVVVDIL